MYKISCIDKNTVTSFYSEKYPELKENIISIVEVKENTLYETDKPIFKIKYSTDPGFIDNPVSECDIMQIYVTRSAARDYCISDNILEDLLESYDMDPDNLGTSNIDKLLKKLNKTGFADYLNVYNHSGVSFGLGFNSGYDTGTIGIVYVDNEVSPDPQECAASEIELLNLWANGECYCLSIDEFKKGDWDNYFSCCGYFGMDDVRSAALDEIKGLPENSIILGFDSDPEINY